MPNFFCGSDLRWFADRGDEQPSLFSKTAYQIEYVAYNMYIPAMVGYNIYSFHVIDRQKMR